MSKRRANARRIDCRSQRHGVRERQGLPGRKGRVKTRLDGLIRKLEADCEALQRAHEAKARAVAQARAALLEMQAKLAQDQRGSDDAAEWTLVEVRRQRLQLQARVAAEQVQAAAKAEAAARVALQAGLQRRQAIQNAADRIRLNAQRVREQREAKELDEVALVRHRAR